MAGLKDVQPGLGITGVPVTFGKPVRPRVSEGWDE